MTKLRIPVRVGRTFQGLPIGLQAVVHLMQQIGHQAMTRVVACALEFCRQLPNALASPSKRRFRIAARHWLYQCLQVALQRSVLLNSPLSSGSFPPDSLAARRLRGRLKFGHSTNHRSSRQATGPSHRRSPLPRPRRPPPTAAYVHREHGREVRTCGPSLCRLAFDASIKHSSLKCSSYLVTCPK